MLPPINRIDIRAQAGALTRQASHRRRPGTKTNKHTNAAVMMVIQIIAIIDRLARRDLTNGSRTLLKWKNVCSLYPAMARRGSMVYWWQAR